MSYFVVAMVGDCSFQFATLRNSGATLGCNGEGQRADERALKLDSSLAEAHMQHSSKRRVERSGGSVRPLL